MERSGEGVEPPRRGKRAADGFEGRSGHRPRAAPRACARRCAPSQRTVIVPGGPATSRPTTGPGSVPARSAGRATSRPPEVVASVSRRRRQAGTSAAKVVKPSAHSALRALPPETPASPGQKLLHPVDRRDGRGVDLRGQAALATHVVQVAEQPEAGHVGHRVRVPGERRLGGGGVQLDHRGDGPREQRVVRSAALARGDDGAHAERLGEHEHVARPARGVREDPLRVDRPGHREPVLRLVVLDRVAADEYRAGLADHVQAAAEDRRQDLRAELLEREGDDVQRRDGCAAHGVDVRERVGRRDPAEVVGIVDQRREEVDRLHERDVGGQPHHRGIVPRRRSDEQPRVVLRREAPHDREQVGGRELAAAARPGGERRQRDGGVRVGGEGG